MAQPSRRLPENVPGDFYVDESCIDCDACRQISPETFRDHGGQSSVYQQPASDAQKLRALMALLACPTASIGTVHKHDTRAAVARSLPRSQITSLSAGTPRNPVSVPGAI